jgi:cytochrome c553
VSHGKRPAARACGLCHYPNGKGRPDNAAVAGLPHEYIVQQLDDFRSERRRSADARREPTREMARIAKALTEDEIRDSAAYFSSMKWTPWITVVETERIPAMRLSGNMFQPVGDGTTEPIGRRVVEAPADLQATLYRNPRSGFVAYVPVGSRERGEALVTHGRGKTVPCVTCHGIDLAGVGPVPGIAGRSPSYLARQLYDFQQGARNGTGAALMKPVVAGLDEEDILAIVAYVSSRTP